MVLLGGFASFFGPLVGAFAFSFLQDTVMSVFPYWRLIFGAMLAVIVGLYIRTTVSRVLLFWAAFILTRPLGATVGDFLDKPVSQGGLALSRPAASAVIAALILLCLFILPQRAGRHPGAPAAVGD